MPTRFPFRRDRYTYIDGARYSTVSGLSITPFKNESGAMFAQRVDHIAREFTKLADVRSVEVEEVYNRDVLVQCIVTTHHDPILTPIELEACEIGRFQPRGSRGGRKAA